MTSCLRQNGFTAKSQRRVRVREPGAVRSETVLGPVRNHYETNNIHAGLLQSGRQIMWWVLLIGVFLLSGQLVDTIEDWRASRSARTDLSRMRQHEAVGDRWDCVRGQWQA